MNLVELLQAPLLPWWRVLPLLPLRSSPRRSRFIHNLSTSSQSPSLEGQLPHKLQEAGHYCSEREGEASLWQGWVGLELPIKAQNPGAGGPTHGVSESSPVIWQ